MIRYELSRAFSSIKFKISFALLMLISVIQSIDAFREFSGPQKFHPADLSLLSNNNNVKFLLIYIWTMPLVLTFMYANNYNYDRINGLHNIYLTKAGRGQYLFSKIIAAMVSAAVVFLVPVAINFAVNCIVMHGGNDWCGKDTWSIEVAGKSLYTKIRHPYTTYLIYIGISTVMISLLGALCQSLCIITKDKKLPYIASFAIWILLFSPFRFFIGSAFVPFAIEYPLIDSLFAILHFFVLTIFFVIICFIINAVKKDAL